MAEDALEYDADKHLLTCHGVWKLPNIFKLQSQFAQIKWPDAGGITIDGSNITAMDSAGAWLLMHEREQLENKKLKITFTNFTPECQSLLDIVAAKFAIEEKTQLPTKPKLNPVVKIGMYSYQQFTELLQYLTFIGKLTHEAIRITRTPKRMRFGSLANFTYRTGFLALPIIALLSFMIGIVIAYQMGIQLRSYGANVYIVDFLGLSVLREFGVLLTAIMIAGRTGSSYTAQLGIMKINQEIDALDTLGVTSAELLILPRIAALFITLPLLTMWSNIFGVFGGMIMANNMLDIGFYQFLQRFHQVIPLKTLFIGLGKAPVFALIIASIGCFQGVLVEGSADSVGRNTTRSVVLSIFFIIVADALFSVLFSKLNL